MLEPPTIADLSQFDLFRILDFVKNNCDPTDKEAPFNHVNYADLYNFAATCKRHRRILWDWSRDMYKSLEIELLQVRTFKKLTIKFNEIHNALEGASKAKKDWYLDVFIRAMLGNEHLECIELSYAPRKYLNSHDEIFKKILRVIQGTSDQEESLNPYPKSSAKVKEIIVNIAECDFFGLGEFRNISKLRLTARFAMFDLVEFCKNNQSLFSLEVNSYLHSDHGKLTYIVKHCPNLKELKFVMNDNGWIRDEEYVRLAYLDKLQQLEIKKPDNIALETDVEMEEDYPCKRPRMDAEYEALIISEKPKEANVPARSLLTAIAAKKRQILARLILKFEIDDDLAETIAKIKSLRFLECGIYDAGSIRHLAKLDKLTKLSLLSRGHLISAEVMELLARHIPVSSFDTKISFSPKGTLFIDSNDPNLFRENNFEFFLKMENFKLLWVCSNMLTAMNHLAILPSFLENGIKIKGNEFSVSFDLESKHLYIYCMNQVFMHEKFTLPVVKNLQSFYMESRAMSMTNILKSLKTHYSTTLREVDINMSEGYYSNPHFLSEEDVAVLAQIAGLQKVGCVLQKLKFIQPLAQLTELESLKVYSEHNPRKVEFARWLLPILERCPELDYFQIALKDLPRHPKKLPKKLPKKFFIHLDSALNRSRVGSPHELEFCMVSSADFKLTEKQRKFVFQMRQTKNMKYATVELTYQDEDEYRVWNF
ncbi:uncharacterized protein LOC111073412 [Drosophila obscura]|uniref:uncharacterized protein LOC111073412 n=1 Tax=Drosophila obscura TaxID=7282 RepID=UPI001BB20E2D|nr:uncharacterized protein LOC111073412 [Drosophila obscura]